MSTQGIIDKWDKGQEPYVRPHKFVPCSTSPSLSCEQCGESREYHWQKYPEFTPRY